MRFFQLNFLRYIRSKSIRNFAGSIVGIVLIITVILCFYGLVFGDYGLLQILHLRNEQRKLCREIEILRIKEKLLEDYKYRLEKDEFLIEKLARERAGLCKPGEIVFVFKEVVPSTADRASQGLDKWEQYR